MNIVFLAILVIFILLFIMATAIYVAIEGSLLGGAIVMVIIICTLMLINFLWRSK